MLARLAGDTEKTRYIAELQNEKEMTAFSPLPLIVLAEDFAARGDIESAERVAEVFTNRFSASEQLIEMLTVQASACLDAKQYEKTIALTEEIISRFDDNSLIGLSRKLQADAYRLSGDWVKAVEGYQKVFSIRTGRNSMAPEILYWIGVCKRVLYKGQPEWAAKAYEASVECLQKLGRKDEAIQTWKEMIADPVIQKTPEGIRAAESLRRASEG
jgi:tetratricopeptide (TPR) repeat protein